MERKSRWPAASSDADFAPYLAGKPDTSVELFWRFVELARTPGPVTFELQNGIIVLCGTKRIFASVRVLDNGLGGGLNLTRRLTDRRVRKAGNLTQSVISHRYFVSSMSDLDEEFARWLAEARAVGDGAHLAH
jgi:Domain of unknown function (DUF5655)